MAEMEHYPNFQKDNYIHPKAAWDKLRMAGARRQNVYLYAATGYGKTELLHRYLRRRRHIWLSGEGLTVETLQEIALPAEATMVIDDLARVLDPAVRREIVSMLDQPGLWLVLAGRCPLPSWLTGPYVNGRLSVIPEEDLRLSEKEIAQLYLSWGVQLPRNLLEKRIIPLVEGSPLGARLLAVEMSRGSSYTEELVNDLTRKFYEYLNQAIYSEWPEEIREMMMQLSLLEHFTIQQAEEMTGRSDVNRLLAQAAEMGNLFSFKDGGYTLRPTVINSMKLRMEKVCDRVRKNELLRRAGTICEKEGNIPRALKLYQDGQCEKEIHALLIDNARLSGPAGGGSTLLARPDRGAEYALLVGAERHGERALVCRAAGICRGPPGPGGAPPGGELAGLSGHQSAPPGQHQPHRGTGRGCPEDPNRASGDAGVLGDGRPALPHQWQQGFLRLDAG